MNVYHPEMKKLSFPMASTYHPSQCKTAYSVAFYSIMANTPEWYAQLEDSPSHSKDLSPSLEQRSEKFAKKLKAKIYTEYIFSNRSKRFHMMMFNYQSGTVSEWIPIIITQMPNGDWKLCTDPAMVDISYYMYFEPQVCKNLLMYGYGKLYERDIWWLQKDHQYILEDIFSQKSWNNGYFGWTPLPVGVLAHTDLPILLKTQPRPKSIHMAPLIDFDNPYHEKERKYNDTDSNFSFSENSEPTCILTDYESKDFKFYTYQQDYYSSLGWRANNSHSPEAALASWYSDQSKDNLLQHSDLKVYNDTILAQYRDGDCTGRTRLLFEYKFGFTYRNKQYAQIYFKVKKDALFKGYFTYGLFGVLLEQNPQTKEWRILTHPTGFPGEMSYVLSRFGIEFWNMFFENSPKLDAYSSYFDIFSLNYKTKRFIPYFIQAALKYKGIEDLLSQSWIHRDINIPTDILDLHNSKYNLYPLINIKENK